MFKRKKKKTGCETPEFISKVPMPPIKPPQFEEKYCTPKSVFDCYIGTVEELDKFISKHEDIIQIRNAEAYWSVKDGALAIVTTQEFVDYFTGRSNLIPNTKEN